MLQQTFEKLVRYMVDKKASDLFITVGLPPCLKVNGTVMPITKNKLSQKEAKDLVISTMNEEQRSEFKKNKELNFAIVSDISGRFRASAFYQRGEIGMVLRRIETVIPTPDSLLLPPILKELVMNKRGIVIFVGATGTGKSTSLAALIGHRNANSRGHIVSIEDPIEYVHQHQGCIITQREVGVDTESFDVALKNTLRQAPDVIMIGEIRTPETMQHAITFAETGHLVLATLHANNANQALDRVSHFFPADRHDQLWMDLSLNLRGIVAQQLVPTKDGKSRRAAIEILLNTPLVADTIRKGDVHKLKEIMTNSTEHGMQTFDQALFALFIDDQISYENAIAHADSKNDLRLMIKMQSDTHASELDAAADNLTIEEDQSNRLRW
ncbi:MAG: PilT/PilU family type 4a pilus ATPase [Porticoccaceae bacterium]|jgi:twitching motility protein PilU|nr:MAG: type IV pili twitching motility protein PilT [SAR92 bacterium BACL16 MAG-120619-bin48]KRP23864.1 MAG: type IV pili twitching motility protein PilT [SAR92 bacterium BACL16 MAG-120322-bin99]MDP4743928.1 PilT/PilU family type 4a pilus ATPase [Porticoccaceae bacterium]MDP4752493.1 PilT/PilU family type 4a pilus ATPase [Porticoccaceae bacterium]MDP4889825.1 PilT/PilU family type 4a pilus ATPase [Porticoccaceae bacterium]